MSTTLLFAEPDWLRPAAAGFILGLIPAAVICWAIVKFFSNWGK